MMIKMVSERLTSVQLTIACENNRCETHIDSSIFSSNRYFPFDEMKNENSIFALLIDSKMKEMGLLVFAAKIHKSSKFLFQIFLFIIQIMHIILIHWPISG